MPRFWRCYILPAEFIEALYHLGFTVGVLCLREVESTEISSTPLHQWGPQLRASQVTKLQGIVNPFNLALGRLQGVANPFNLASDHP